jgi:hypothetical protein
MMTALCDFRMPEAASARSNLGQGEPAEAERADFDEVASRHPVAEAA